MSQVICKEGQSIGDAFLESQSYQHSCWCSNCNPHGDLRDSEEGCRDNDCPICSTGEKQLGNVIAEYDVTTFPFFPEVMVS